MHSSPYKHSVSQTVTDVIDQLRLFRCFDTSINKCVGFTFPKFASGNSENRTCVTKITVSFINCRFYIRLIPLLISEVKREIEIAVRGTTNFRFTFNPFLSFMRFSPQYIMEIADTFHVDVEQVRTRHSILLKSSDAFWKYIPSITEDRNYGVFLKDIKGVNPKHIVLPSKTVLHRGLMFYKFPKQIPPLTKSEAKQCLHDLVTKTATALLELHGFGYAYLGVKNSQTFALPLIIMLN